MSVLWDAQESATGRQDGSWSSSQWRTTCNNTCTGSVHHTCGTGTGWQQLPELHQECTILPSVREAGLRACRPVLTGNNVAYGHKPTFAGPDRTGKKLSSLTSCGFVSPGVIVGFAFIVKGMSITSRPLLWSRIDFEVEGPSWSGAVCHSIIGLSLLSLPAVSTLCVYREDILLPHVVPFLQAHPDMTLQYDNATSHTAHSVHSLPYLMQLVATHYFISVSHISVELVQFMSQLLNLYMFIQIFTRVKFAENKCSWQWEDVSFFAEFIFY